jgi:predicted transcriptional regulator
LTHTALNTLIAAAPREPRHLIVQAALQRDDLDATEPQVQTLFAWMAEQVAQRHPTGSDAARAMLDMRCIYLSGLWKELTAFRIQRESRRLDPGSAANDADFSQPLAA